MLGFRGGVLNEQTAPLDVATMSVALSRVTRIEDLKIWPIDLKDPQATEHLTRLRRVESTEYWSRGYDKEGRWDPENLRSVHMEKTTKLQMEFAKVKLDTLKMDSKYGTNGLKYWLRRFGICHQLKKAEALATLRPYWDAGIRQTQSRTTQSQSSRPGGV